MSEVKGISSIDNQNTYNSSSTINSENGSGFSSFLGETKSMDEIFEQASEKYDVPVELLKAIGKAESNFDADAVSKCGAQGVMQLMPATAKELGVSDSFDPEQNIMGGAKYISGLLKKYDGNTQLALAAYNAGSGNVKKYGGIPPFTETQNYVKKVMKYMGEGDIEISASNNNVAKNGSAAGIRVTVAAPATQIRNNYGYLLANGINSTDSELDDLKELFSYDDYLKFIDLFLENNKEENTKGNEAAYSSQEISFNVPVLNLLKDQKLI
jgi:hypothetical protein